MLSDLNHVPSRAAKARTIMSSPAPSRLLAGSKSFAPRARNLTLYPMAAASVDQTLLMARPTTERKEDPCRVRVFFLATPFILSVRPQQLREQSSDGVDVFDPPNYLWFDEQPVVVDGFHLFHRQPSVLAPSQSLSSLHQRELHLH